MDYGIKLFKYRLSNVREYWLIDPDKDRIMVWNFENNDTFEYSLTDCVPVGIYDDFEIDFSKGNPLAQDGTARGFLIS